MKHYTSVIFVQKIFPTYREPLFDALKNNIKFKFLAGKNKSGIKTGNADYVEPIFSIQYGKKDTQLLLFPLFKIIRYKPKVVICEFALGILNLPLIILTCRLLNIRMAFWSHGYNRKTGFHPKERIVDKYRLFLLNLVDANIVYSEFDKKLLQKYLKKQPIFVTHNTLDTNHLSSIKKRLQKEGKSKIKKRLGIEHEKNIIFIGRLIPSKKPALLIQIYSELRRKHNVTVGVHYIGDGEMLSDIRNEVNNLNCENDFYFHGAIWDDFLNGQLLFISDIMVNPGALGLSINHAFCFGCPIISFKTINNVPPHGPEIDYLIHRKMGFLIEEHSAEAMASTISDYLKAEYLQIKFKKNIQFAVEHVFPIERMLADFLECIQFLLKKK